MHLETVWRYTGVESYEYGSLCGYEEREVNSYCQTMRTKAAMIANFWSPDLSTEWAIRNYLAVKMILAGQLLLNGAHYAERKNLAVVKPYLLYYALLSACRALVFTDLTIEWRNGALRLIGHDKIRNNTVNAIRRLSNARAVEIDQLMLAAKAQRELFSYSFPAQGLAVLDVPLALDTIAEAATLICDLAEANSECLEAEWTKKSGLVFQADLEKLRELSRYDAEPVLIDRDDSQRTSYLGRNYKGPACLVSIARPGMIEDFYGAWCPNDEVSETDLFNPDQCDAPGIFTFQ